MRRNASKKSITGIFAAGDSFVMGPAMNIKIYRPTDAEQSNIFANLIKYRKQTWAEKCNLAVTLFVMCEIISKHRVNVFAHGVKNVNRKKWLYEVKRNLSSTANMTFFVYYNST